MRNFLPLFTTGLSLLVGFVMGRRAERKKFLDQHRRDQAKEFQETLDSMRACVRAKDTGALTERLLDVAKMTHRQVSSLKRVDSYARYVVWLREQLGQLADICDDVSASWTDQGTTHIDGQILADSETLLFAALTARSSAVQEWVTIANPRRWRPAIDTPS